MIPIENQSAHGTPERAVADAFSAFRRRDVARLAAAATNASIRALAARVGPELDAGDTETPADSTRELTDSQAASILGRLVAQLPERFTDSVTCLILGHVLESRLVVATPDGRGLIPLDCRVTSGDTDWLTVYADPQIGPGTSDHAAGVAHVVFRVAYELPGQGIVPFPPEFQIATTRVVSGKWKLALDEWSAVGLPGFRGVGIWIDEASPNETATDD